MQTGRDGLVQAEQVPALVATLALLQLHLQPVDVLLRRVVQVAVLDGQVEA